MGRLDGKTIFVTGAAAGLGRASALRFAQEGARVIATDRDAKQLAALSEQLGRPHEAFPLDVTDHDAISAAADGRGDVDTLFNCAGWVHQGKLEDTSVADWQRSFDINVTGMFVVCQAFLPHFRAAGRGNIVNVASVASSMKAVANRVAYMSSKAAVIALTKSIAFDYLHQGIRANAIAPGTIDSPSLHDRARALGDHDEVWKTFIARQPMGRMASAEEIAHLVVYLASDESAYATGSVFTIDGGITM
jgi:NAD(P)-dependent dehydrogenase (short-subunit alcohol dehydrogenase family)